MVPLEEVPLRAGGNRSEIDGWGGNDNRPAPGSSVPITQEEI
jgi:hypothetical protein